MGVELQNGCLAFGNDYRESEKCNSRKFKSEEQKNAIKFGVTLFKSEI